jgi:hypothetical protein
VVLGTVIMFVVIEVLSDYDYVESLNYIAKFKHESEAQSFIENLNKDFQECCEYFRSIVVEFVTRCHVPQDLSVLSNLERKELLEQLDLNHVPHLVHDLTGGLDVTKSYQRLISVLQTEIWHKRSNPVNWRRPNVDLTDKSQNLRIVQISE